MNKEFKFDIPNTRSKQIRLLTSLILFLNGLVFIYMGIQHRNASLAVPGTMAAVPAIVELFLWKKNWQLNRYASAFIAIGYFRIEAWYFGVLFFVLYLISEKIAGQKVIGFTQSDILLKAPFTRKIPWTALQNVVLKDGLLTLDFKNNKLLQTPIINDLSEAKINQFNDFCREKLKAEGLGV